MPCTFKAVPVSALSRAVIAAMMAQRAAYAGNRVIEELRGDESADKVIE
jgi:hypothetical protein